MYFTIRHGKRLARRCSSRDSRESRELQGPDQRLGNCNVSPRSRLGQNFERLGLGDIGLESRLGLGSEGFVHISAILTFRSAAKTFLNI